MTGRKSWRSRRSSLGLYILDANGEPRPIHDVLQWAHWFETHPEARRVARTEVGGRVVVQTDFLGLDHSFYMQLQPALWGTIIRDLAETTMPLGGPMPGFTFHATRGDPVYYTSRAAALIGHLRVVAIAERLCQEADAKGATSHQEGL